MKKLSREEIAGSRRTLQKLMAMIGASRVQLSLSILLAGVSVVLTLYAPILFGRAIDRMIGAGQVDFTEIAGTCTQILIAVSCAGLATWLMNILNNRMTYQVVQQLRGRAIRQLQVLPLSYLDGHSVGDIESRIIADSDQLSDGLLLGFTQLFSGVITIIVTLAFMLSKSIEITLLVIVLTPLSFFAARYIATHSYAMFRRQSEIRGRETALIEEMVGEARTVKAFGYSGRASERFAKINDELQDCSEKATFFSSLTNPSTRFVNSVIYAAVALSGSYMILAGRLSVGGLSVLLSYANQYMKPFNDISSVVTELQNALACAGRVFDLIEQQPETAEKPEELPAASGSVTAQDVSFRYEEDRPLIEHFNLQAAPGMRIAIVGPTGCGKTTFINLLMRFYEVRSGAIRIDGTDIREVTRHSLRRSYGMVLQDTWLKSGTIRDNITIGRPEATEEEILAAAAEAHSLEFIRRMPKGLDTEVSEDSMSAGEKQLLCITRVMLCRPPMLILDEATSSIDTRTELQVQDAFDRLMKGRTSFIVAHRLSTIRGADLILVMKDGQIIEQGTHESLLAAKGFYSQLYLSQFAPAE